MLSPSAKCPAQNVTCFQARMAAEDSCSQFEWQVCALTVKWWDEATLRRDVEREQGTMTSEFEAMVGELLDNRALTRDEAKAARAGIHIELDDQRSNRRHPLPHFGKPARPALVVM